ncbi:K02A2.6-like [Cordylochernes scorpioides]|uniref:K02A2.6-like n=1 Tax=Cordylochernes scorpioides TaxID=51811 RepID=A0ABY6KF56_9ARAC|nr:K02A2.6-like [Cordylochernes scorpioides]
MVTNNQVFDGMGKERQLIKFIKQRNVAFAGHVKRGSAGETLLTVLEGKLRGKRSRGRRRQGYTDDLKQWTGRHTYEEMKRMAEEEEDMERPCGQSLSVGEGIEGERYGEAMWPVTLSRRKTLKEEVWRDHVAYPQYRKALKEKDIEKSCGLYSVEENIEGGSMEKPCGPPSVEEELTVFLLWVLKEDKKQESSKMETNEIRAVIKYLCKKGMLPMEIFEGMVDTLREDAPSYSPVKKWVAAFKLARISTEDEHRPGGPVESVTQENIDKIHVLVMLDRRMTVRRIEETLGIPKTTVDRIMREHLGLRELSARWVPKLLTPDQKAVRKIYFRTILRYLKPIQRNLSVYLLPWMRLGPITSHQSPSKNPCNGELPVPFPPRKPRQFHQQGRKIVYHQDNAPSLRLLQAMASIYDSGFEPLPHAPYSPDLATSDFNLFPHLKKSLSGIHFRSDEKVIDAVTSFFESLETLFFLEGIKALEHRWKKTGHFKGMKINPDMTRSYRNCNNCHNTQLTRDHIYSCPAILTALYMTDINSLEDIHTDKAPQLAGIVIRVMFDRLSFNWVTRFNEGERGDQLYPAEYPKTCENNHSRGSPFLFQYLSAFPLVGGHERDTRRPTDATKWFHIAASIEQNRASIQFKPKNKIHLATKNNDDRKNVCPFWCPICSKKGIKIKHWVTDCEDYDPNYKKDRPNQNTSVKQVCGAPELLNVSTLTNTPTQGAFKLINISVEVNGIPAQAFVDTGATVSIINWRLFKRTRLQLQPNSDIHISQADGVTRTCGSLQTKVRIDKLIKPVTLHVMKNFKYPLLIGLDVASLFNLLIDVKDKTIYTKFDGLQNPILVNHLEEIREHELKKLLEHLRNVFCQHAIDLGKVAIQHKIITKSEQPISLRPYRRPLKEYEEIAEQVKELLEHKLIRTSYSPWAFPVVMVPKKDGNKRMCIDYRRLNEITLDDRQPLPHIQDMFDRLHGSRFFSTLDVAWGYWQIEMDPQSIQKTAFVTNDGHYEFLVMPFGLKNAASTFQRIIQHILGELLWKGTCSFQDDILVYTKTWQEHIELLSKVFDKLRQYNMKLKLSKCIFGRTEVKYLGHIISHNQLKPDPGKVKSIQDFPRPDTVKKVRQFMGLANYYRKFVKDFSKISFPLVRLTRKNQPFIWNEEVEESFAKLKMALFTKPVLAIYNPDYPSKVYTDASKYGIGAILTQIGPDNEEHVIAYYSKTLQPHQENYSAYEMECLAVIQATDHFHVYIENLAGLTFVENLSTILDSNGFSFLKGCPDYTAILTEIPAIIRIATEQSIQNDMAKILNTSHYSHFKYLKCSITAERYL